MTLILRGGQVLLKGQSAFSRADLLIEEDRIAAIGPDLTAPENARVMDASGFYVIPGLVNAHTHGQGGLMRGVGDNWTLELQLCHGQSFQSGRSPEDQYLSTALNAAEMLRTGCTATYDLFIAFPRLTEDELEAVVQAYTDVGLRVVLVPQMADVVPYRTVPGLLELLPSDLRATVEAIAPNPTEGQLQLTERAIRRWQGAAGGRIRMATGPTIPNLSTDELLSGCARLAREYGVGVHTHVAEIKTQVIYSRRRWGKTIVARLDDMGLLGPGFVAAHAVWLTDEDMSRLAEAGAAVAHNPASNLKLGSGIAPVREMLDAGIPVGLGADSNTCSDNQNMFETMRIAALVNKVRFPYRPERWLGSREVWELATLGSARVLVMADEIGAIEPGRKADLALLRVDSPWLRPMNDSLNSLVYVETGASVDTVMVDGRVLVERGRVLGVDEERLRARAQEAVDRARHGNPAAGELGRRLAPYVARASLEAAAEPYPVNRHAG